MCGHRIQLARFKCFGSPLGPVDGVLEYGAHPAWVSRDSWSVDAGQAWVTLAGLQLLGTGGLYWSSAGWVLRRQPLRKTESLNQNLGGLRFPHLSLQWELFIKGPGLRTISKNKEQTNTFQVSGEKLPMFACLPLRDRTHALKGIPKSGDWLSLMKEAWRQAAQSSWTAEGLGLSSTAIPFPAASLFFRSICLQIKVVTYVVLAYALQEAGRTSLHKRVVSWRCPQTLLTPHCPRLSHTSVCSWKPGLMVHFFCNTLKMYFNCRTIFKV